MKALSFASLSYESKKKKTRREQFLEEMDQVIPWETILKIISPYYSKAGNGRKPMLLEVMLRILTNAAVHDSKVMDKLLHGEEKAVYGDKAYVGEDRQRDCESRGIEWCVKRKAVSGRKLSAEDREYNHRQGKVRAKVEHVFQVVKHQWNYRKVRYQGLYKNTVEVPTY